MKSIVESLKEILLEKYGSSIIGDLFSELSQNGHEDDILKRYAWDRIKDENLKKISVQEALKIAYKRTGSEWDNLILWIKDNKLFAWSIGNFMYRVIGETSWRGTYSSIKAMCNNANIDYAYLLENRNDFETQELRRLRREAQENAAALEKAEDIKDKNLKRYRKLIAKGHFDAKFSEVMEILKNITEKYSNAMVYLCNPENSFDRKKLDLANNLNYMYKDFMFEYSNILYIISSSPEEGNEYFYQGGLEDIDEFKKEANKILRFIEKISQ